MASNEAANLFSVKGQVVVITGGGSGKFIPSFISKPNIDNLGIGAMMANALDANGASKVYVLGRRAGSLEKVASAAVGTPNSLTLYQALTIAAHPEKQVNNPNSLRRDIQVLTSRRSHYHC
jgi:hypothetical protein